MTTRQQPKPVKGTCRLTKTEEGDFLTINGTDYLVTWIASHQDIGSPAFQLVKMFNGTPSSRVYHVILTEHGATCDCPDWVFNRNHKDARGCKHVLALRATRLLPKGYRENP